MTFRVRKRFKESTKNQEDRIRHIRLFFTSRDNNNNDMSKGKIPSKNANDCFSRALIRHNKRYILFLRESSESEEDMSRQKFHLVSGPVQKSKSFIRSMKKYLCRNCGKFIANYIRCKIGFVWNKNYEIIATNYHYILFSMI